MATIYHTMPDRLAAGRTTPKSTVHAKRRQSIHPFKMEPDRTGPLVGDEDEPACVICLEHFPTTELSPLHDDHIFHRECLSIWLRDHPTCPVCRKRFGWIEVLRWDYLPATVEILQNARRANLSDEDEAFDGMVPKHDNKALKVLRELIQEAERHALEGNEDLADDLTELINRYIEFRTRMFRLGSLSIDRKDYDNYMRSDVCSGYSISHKGVSVEPRALMESLQAIWTRHFNKALNSERPTLACHPDAVSAFDAVRGALLRLADQTLSPLRLRAEVATALPEDELCKKAWREERSFRDYAIDLVDYIALAHAGCEVPVW